jgi:hypothetical protein
MVVDTVAHGMDYLKILVGMDMPLVGERHNLVILAVVIQIIIHATAQHVIKVATAQHVMKVAIAKHVLVKVVVLAVIGIAGVLGLT